MYTSIIGSHLKNFSNKSTYIEASAIVSKDGMVIASVLPKNIDEDFIGGMTAAMLSISNHSTQHFMASESEQIMIKSAKGTILMIYAGTETVLTVMTKPNARLDFILLEMNRLAIKITATLISSLPQTLVA